jgi:hypothetical protein
MQAVMSSRKIHQFTDFCFVENVVVDGPVKKAPIQEGFNLFKGCHAAV